MKAFWIKTNNDVEELTPANGTEFELEELQRLVGGYIEVRYLSLPVTLYNKGIPYTFNSGILVMNEEGKIDRLPYNEQATVALQRDGNPDYIVGDAVICDAGMLK